VPPAACRQSFQLK